MTYKPDDKTLERLKVLGTLKNQPPEELMEQALQEFLEREETSLESLAICHERLDRFESTGEYISHDDMVNFVKDLKNGKKSTCQISRKS